MGLISLCVAENKLCHEMLEEKFKKTKGFEGKEVSYGGRGKHLINITGTRFRDATRASTLCCARATLC